MDSSTDVDEHFRLIVDRNANNLSQIIAESGYIEHSKKIEIGSVYSRGSLYQNIYDIKANQIKGI